MKKLLFLPIILSFFFADIQAQTRRSNNADAARAYSSVNQNETVQPLLIQARTQFRKADFQGALNKLDEAVAQNPNSAEALAERARFKKIVGRDAEAEMDLRKANQINPFAANVYGYYGTLGLVKVLASEATISIQKITDHENLTYYYCALNQEMLVPDENSLKWDDLENVLLDIENKELASAKSHIDDFLIKYPTTSKGFDLKGLVLEEQGKIEEAIEAFKRAVELDPEADISWFNLGHLERMRGNYALSEKYLNKAIELNDELTRAYFERAMTLKHLGKEREAIKSYNRVLVLEGDSHMDVLVNRGFTKKLAGDFAGARKDISLAIESDPQNGKLRRTRGNLSLLLGAPRKAIDDYTKAIQLNENDGKAYYDRGIAFLTIYDKISACEDLKNSEKRGYKKAKEVGSYFCSW